MSGEFEVLSKPFVPAWRRKRTRTRRVLDFLMASASLAGIVLAWQPWSGENPLQTPISVQLAHGDSAASALFVFMGIVLCAMAVRLWRSQRHGSAMLMAVEVAALLLMSRTDPASFEHLFVFGAAALSSAWWLAALALDLEDAWLYVAALAGVAAIFLIPSSLGIGERALITSCLAGMNLMFFRHFS